MTSLLTVKLRRDLRATWPRIAMMVVAIAVSLTVFSTVLYAWSAISRETEQAYLSTEPASATIRFDPAVDAEEMALIAADARTQPGVIEATGRTVFSTDVEVNGSMRETPLQVFAAAPDDPLRMANFEVEQGSWPPAAGEIFIRRDSLTLLDVAVGDTVTVETPDGEPAQLQVAGTVYDPSLAPAGQQQTGQGYLSTASLAAVGEPDVFDQLKIQIADPGGMEPSRDRHTIVAAAGDVGEWLQQEHGLAIQEIQVPTPYAHPHQGQADALLTTLFIGAGAALLLSTILVANMLNGIFTQQIPQIGIMKAIGARSGRIGRLYLTWTLMVAGAATLLALIHGRESARHLGSCRGGWRGQRGRGVLSVALGGAGVVLFFALVLLYYLVLEWAIGQTVGKLLVGLRVVRAGGGRPSVWAVAIRTVLRAVDWLPLLYLVGFIAILSTGARPRRLGDLAAGTVIVRAVPMRHRRLAAAGLAASLAVILAGSIVYTAANDDEAVQTYRDETSPLPQEEETAPHRP